MVLSIFYATSKWQSEKGNKIATRRNLKKELDRRYMMHCSHFLIFCFLRHYKIFHFSPNTVVFNTNFKNQKVNLQNLDLLQIVTGFPSASYIILSYVFICSRIFGGCRYKFSFGSSTCGNGKPGLPVYVFMRLLLFSLCTGAFARFGFQKLQRYCLMMQPIYLFSEF